MQPKIAVVDYGMGNLRSVSKALEAVGADVLVSDSKQRIADCDAIVLPGVGSFKPAADYLKKKGLFNFLKKQIAGGKHFLGLCLGFQLLFDKSSEEGSHAGLEVVPGEVLRFNLKPPFKIPHMGWNTLSVSKNAAETMFSGIPASSYFYFVHSYYGIPKDKSFSGSTTAYGIKFCSSICKDNVWACQFHPEKSSKYGLKLLGNFTREVKKCL
ncbi:MAG TPA: imidazole glycerol phosphate synthase subunit HisH [Elusimicrobia bacterium]|nr:MAG: imidazole glycerol phosphate synthase, glutamine amidotransferase subunit [Elusimicrobia bacterium RIFOXYA12_FULL_49_49]OGS09243.1 MAG: imidazole glycerol phosphate synthase, glutamine amidotransferase subunit [Elusimicrobia bacterium RIFOXYA1_FULL_47_7]OGS11892.1 MAG: imidazole glycerol phosphate synthase, glutamine amidotransferase subunit [Elusimicrobia bacterium RIFOXYB1_FULL_48_9]OGS16848.1 MAG: imidazole glycerol phosphate synthase, glutamine amidotransferase subunit [Elusimicrobia